MRRLCCAVAIGLALAVAGSAALAQAPLPEGFAGKFRGSLSDRGGYGDGQFTVVIKTTDAGFTVSWPPRIAARFEAAGRPGVFRTRERSLILEGDPFYWARIDGESLIVYVAQIGEHGGYRIDSFRYTVWEDGLDVVVRQVVSGGEPRVSTGRLSRYDG